MKSRLLLCYFITLAFNLSGQETRNHVLSEFNVSLNKTRVADYNTEDRSGMGAGVYHSFFPGKVINLMVGIEFNQVRQFKYTSYSGHMSAYNDLTYIFNGVSVPFGLRFNTGKNIKLFIESGAFTDIPIHCLRKGTITYLNIVPNQVYKEITTTISEKIVYPPSAGIYCGAGIAIPVSRFELIIKSDYKHGLNDVDYSLENLNCRYLRLLVGIRWI